MSDIIIIPNSNCVRFIKENSDTPNLFNRVESDNNLNRLNTFHKIYSVFDVSDNINIQFSTNRPVQYLYLYRLVGNTFTLVETIVPTKYTLDSGYVYYQVSRRMDFEYDNYLYFKLVFESYNGFPQVVYNTNPFKVSDLSEDYRYKKITWTGSDVDGIYYDETDPLVFTARYRLDLQEISIVEDSGVFNDANGTINYLYGLDKLQFVAENDPLPFYLVDILKLAFSHKKVTVAGEEYVRIDGSTKITTIKRSNLYNFSITLQLVNYENYFDIMPTDEYQNVSDSNNLLVNDTDKMLINDTDKMLI